MSYFLLIETSQKPCSVALAKNDLIVSNLETFEEKAHTSNLPVFIKKIMEDAGLEFNQLSAVAVSKGPGSYTGLRIGVSAAKGICYGADLPLIAIDTLKIMCYNAISSFSNIDNNVLLCPMIDARRMEVYYAIYNTNLIPISETNSKIIETGCFDDILENNKIYFFGDGAEKTNRIIKHPNAYFIRDVFPLARFMTKEAKNMFNNKEFADTAYFEPFYLKEFQTTTQKKNIFK
jgi:tRNA threonylcarbamoyladenosine biosynthesis protein TsaB